MLSKAALKSRYLQYRGSYVVYLVMRFMAKLYKTLFVACNDIIVPTIWGAKFLLPNGPSFAESRYQTLMRGMVEPEWRDYFDQFVIISRVFIDIGTASDGYYTIRARKLNPKIKVVAVEPCQNEFKYLLQNIKLNSCTDKVIPVNVALGRKQGVVELSNQQVTCLTLDDLVQNLQLPSVDVIKIDVKGPGAEMLWGGLKTVHSYKPIIFFEVHNAFEKQAVRELRRRGYEVVKKGGDSIYATPHTQGVMKALKELLTHHGFEVVHVKGAPGVEQGAECVGLPD